VNRIESTRATTARMDKRSAEAKKPLLDLRPAEAGKRMTAKTVPEAWERHEVVPETADTPAVIYIDCTRPRVTSPQAFSVLASAA